MIVQERPFSEINIDYFSENICYTKVHIFLACNNVYRILYVIFSFCFTSYSRKDKWFFTSIALKNKCTFPYIKYFEIIIIILKLEEKYVLYIKVKIVTFNINFISFIFFYFFFLFCFLLFGFSHNRSHILEKNIFNWSTKTKSFVYSRENIKSFSNIFYIDKG